MSGRRTCRSRVKQTARFASRRPVAANGHFGLKSGRASTSVGTVRKCHKRNFQARSTAPSSLPRRYANGWAGLRSRHCSSHRARPGRMATRELQRQAQGRFSEHGDLLRAEGGPDPHRAVAAFLQHRETAQCARLQATGSRSHLTTRGPAGLRSGAGQPTAGPRPCQILTLELDHQRGPGQPSNRVQAWEHDVYRRSSRDRHLICRSPRRPLASA